MRQPRFYRSKDKRAQPSGRLRARSLGLAGLLTLGACSLTEFQGEQASDRPLSTPERVVVYDFAFAPDQVRLDRGLDPEVADLLKVNLRSAQEHQAGRAFASTLSSHLVEGIFRLGLIAGAGATIPGTAGVFVGTTTGLFHVHDGVVDRFTAKSGLPADKVQTLTTLDGGRLLIGTAHGVYRSQPELNIERLRQLNAAGRTVLVVHHDLRTVATYFDSVVLLNMRLVASGPMVTPVSSSIFGTEATL